MADITIKRGVGVKQLWYDVKYPGESLEPGGPTTQKYFNRASYVKVYCDQSDLDDDYSLPITVSYYYRNGSGYVYKDDFYPGYYIGYSIVATFNATEASKTITYVYNDGTELKATFKKKKGETHYIIKRPKRQGKVFLYWTDNLGTGKHWRAGDAYTTNANVTFTGVWVSKTYFYWHGSNDNDSAYFQVGKRVDLAVTATNWNNLRTYINMLREYCYLSAVSLGTVSEESEISASGFNTYSNAIQDCVNAMGGTSPPTVSEGALIRVSDYNGPGSIKAAANSVMDAL